MHSTGTCADCAFVKGYMIALDAVLSGSTNDACFLSHDPYPTWNV